MRKVATCMKLKKMITWRYCPVLNLSRINTIYDALRISTPFKILWKRGKRLLTTTFPSCRRFLTPLQQTAFWKHSDKRRNCTKRAISPFATMFSTFVHRLSIQLWRFSMFWQNTFKVVCCRFVVWGKGLTSTFPSSHELIFFNNWW